jgi:hypothetical protein
VVRANPSPSLNDVQVMINSALEKQAKSTNELLCRLIEERDGKKHGHSSVNPSSSTCIVSFTQTNPHTSGPSAGDTSMPNPSAQSMSHFHSRTSMYGQGYTHTALSFTVPNPSSTPYTSMFNGRAYPNPNGNFQALYTTRAYTDPIPLLGSSLGFLPNHAYQIQACFNVYGQPKTSAFGYETPPQFPFRSQPIDMTLARATTEPGTDPNTLTNQLATILQESFDIEPQGRGCVYQKPYPNYYNQLPYPRVYRVTEFSKFSGEDGKTTLEHVGQFILQCGEASANDALKLRMFLLSLSGTAFTWFTSLAPNSIFTWAQLEQKFYEYFYYGDTELRLSHLTAIKQKHNESATEYIRRSRDTRNRCFNLNISDKDLAYLAYSGLTPHLKDKLESHMFSDVSQVLQWALDCESRARV